MLDSVKHNGWPEGDYRAWLTISERWPGRVMTINDLAERECSGEPLSEEEREAVRNFSSFQLATLKREKEEKRYHDCYKRLQVMANLLPYQEFLKAKYSA